MIDRCEWKISLQSHLPCESVRLVGKTPSASLRCRLVIDMFEPQSTGVVFEARGLVAQRYNDTAWCYRWSSVLGQAGVAARNGEALTCLAPRVASVICLASLRKTLKTQGFYRRLCSPTPANPVVLPSSQRFEE